MNNNLNLRECYHSGVKPTISYQYEFYTNDVIRIWKKPTITGNDLHLLNNTSPETHFIRMRSKKGKDLVGPNTVVDLTECGIERFIILPYEQEKINLNECFCKGVVPTITYEYELKINRESYITTKEVLTGSEIFSLAGKDPKTHRLRMFSRGGKNIISVNDSVDLTECGVERFIIEPLECTEGLLKPEETINLLPEDIHFFQTRPINPSILKESGFNWVIFRDLRVPEGYNVSTVDAAILIPSNYPAARLDMIYFFPHLTRSDNKPIGAVTPRSIEGKIYQRWSRHRSASNPWNPEKDNLKSHLELMLTCLIDEFNKR